MISEEQVRHIASLARLGLKEGEDKKFAGQLSEILSYVEMLNEVDTSDVKPTSQVTGLENVKRKDEINHFSSKDELLKCTELPVEQDQIRVKPVITEL